MIGRIIEPFCGDISWEHVPQRDLSWVKFWPIVTEFLVQVKELKTPTGFFQLFGHSHKLP